MNKHPTPSPHSSNHGPGPGRWLYAAFLSASLTPLLSRPAFAATIWTKASEVTNCPFALHVGQNKKLVKRKEFEEFIRTSFVI